MKVQVSRQNSHINGKYRLVIWKNTEYNIGSAYDARSGIFTCPYNGIYSFYVTSPVYKQHDTNIRIYVNGSSKVYHYLHNHGGGVYEFKHSSPYAVLKLSKGDIVHIYMTGLFHYANTQCTRTYFQGHLVDLL